MKILSVRSNAWTGLLSTGLVVAGLVIIPTGSAFAQAKPATPTPAGSGQALEIAPPVVNLAADPGQVINTQLQIRDISPTSLVVSSQVNDFQAAGEDGTPKILLDSSEDTPNSIKKWVSPIAPLTLQPRQIRALPVSISVPANAAPGGYYGVIRFTAAPPGLKQTGVALSASLGSLVLIRVNGQASEKMSIASFITDGGNVFQALPVKFTERLKNEGNVFEQPSGQVSISDIFGKKVAAVNVNLPPRNVLPSSIRKFDQSLDESVIGNKRLFGKYTATLNLTYGANKQTVSEKLTFWVIPYQLIGIILVIIIVLAVVIRLMLKSYTNRILKGSRGRRR